MIVAIANQKGGVGKTTTAINLSAAFALRGKPTLLIDLDPQGNSSLSFLDARRVERSVYDAMVDPTCSLADVILPTTHEHLSVAPARISLAKLEAKLVGEIDAHFKLKDRLDQIRDQYGAIVIDCPPTLGLLTVNALVASTHLLIPIQSSYFALEGTDDLLETVEKVRARANPGLQIVGVVITMHDRRTSLARDIRSQINKVFGPKVFRTLISKSVRLEESPAYKESIFSFAPDSSGATEYYSLSEEVIERV
jgi:chromosome partitioning protein